MLLALLAAGAHAQDAVAAPAPEAEAATTMAVRAMCAEGAGIVGLAGLVSPATGRFYALSVSCAAAADPMAAVASVLLPVPESLPVDAEAFDSGAPCNIANAVVGYSAAEPAAVTKLIVASVAGKEGESACSFGAGVDGDSEARISLACGGAPLAGLSAQVAAPSDGAPFIASLTIVCQEVRAASATSAAGAAFWAAAACLMPL